VHSHGGDWLAVELGENVTIGPCAVIGEDASIGAGTRIEAGAVIGEGVRIGEHCRIYPHAVLYPGTTLGNRVIVHAGAVLGADGFGYVRDSATGAYTQFPQQGRW
jgi:UDP-3-O-[3-hydroxymyristoyl] glucosamine N-acyltransferase